jgi:hypothetical protein
MTNPAPKFRQVAAQPIMATDEELLKLSGELGMPTLTPVDRVIEVPTRAVDHIPEPVAERDPVPSQAPIVARSRTEKKPKAPAPEITDTAEKITVEIPTYVADQVRRRAFEERSSARYLVLQGLKKLGFDVDSADLVPNYRRSRSK